MKEVDTMAYGCMVIIIMYGLFTKKVEAMTIESGAHVFLEFHYILQSLID